MFNCSVVSVCAWYALHSHSFASFVIKAPHRESIVGFGPVSFCAIGKSKFTAKLKSTFTTFHSTDCHLSWNVILFNILHNYIIQNQHLPSLVVCRIMRLMRRIPNFHGYFARGLMLLRELFFTQFCLSKKLLSWQQIRNNSLTAYTMPFTGNECRWWLANDQSSHGPFKYTLVYWFI